LGGKALLPVCMMDSVNRFAPHGRRLGPSGGAPSGSKPTMAQVRMVFLGIAMVDREWLCL
jgi:hypothetical protein